MIAMMIIAYSASFFIYLAGAAGIKF